MLKNEQSRSINQPIRAPANVPPASLPSHPPMMFHQTSTTTSQRSVDLNAVDISSMKGRFAWETIPQSDTYMPAIFRGETRYFCVRMLRKVLSEYPEDVIRRSPHYHYQYPIDIYSVTSHESDLLNRINSHHSRWAYTRQAFTVNDELVRVADFLPFYEHLRQCSKSGSLPSSTPNNASRQPLPPPSQISHRPSSMMSSNNLPSTMYAPPAQPARASLQRYPPPHLPNALRACGASTIRPMAPEPSILRHSRPAHPAMHSTAAVLPTYNPSQPPPPPRLRALLPPPQHLQPQPPLQLQIPVSMQSDRVAHVPASVPCNDVPIIASVHCAPAPARSPTPMASSVSPSVRSLTDIPGPPPSTLSSSPTGSLPTAKTNRKLSTSSISSSSSTSITKSPRVNCGWVQINKLFSPYISTSTGNHHEYKIPVNLLIYYDLLKKAPTEPSDSTDTETPFEQMLATPQEIEMLNELCTQHAVNAFANDTKLITLPNFYQHCSANIIFVKELPLNEPKASICKDWLSIVQIYGGICRLRNIATLHEQTVPFIGHNLLKTFILSSQCLARASLTKPTEAELEFLQMILFFSNLSINLRQAQLIDVESVKKEYNVDLILLFNDKFPRNVLDYQQQGNRSNSIPTAALPTSSSAPTNTIAESTPPPSPPSPVVNQPASNPPAQLPLTPATNRYQKMIEFHGHSMTAYICSGIGSNAQRECVSIRSLCMVLFPNSELLDKLELKMLRLLRSKKINRFRPQIQQLMGITRLIDVRDAEKHWDFLERGMRLISSNIKPAPISSTESPISNESPAASAQERADDVQRSSPDTEKGEKRSLDEPLEEEDIPVMQRLNKRVRYAEKENSGQLTGVSVPSVENIDGNSTPSDTQYPQGRPTKKRTPSSRSKKQSIAGWARKYQIEDCCILLDPCDRMLDAERRD